ncbi:MAG TPA: serine/threonine-protein kinase [Thermoanaerobaculia bacterium]|nr:serine/threonine-protein kinase [Thermoanaerobaculia bacterium]
MPTSRIHVQQRYAIEGELGSGAMGTVYLAHDQVIDRRVVLKTLRRDRDEATEEEQEALVDEARSAGRINHPNLVTVYDVVNDLETDRVYLALEYVDGRTLRDVIREVGRLEVEEAVDVTLQVAAGLAHLHEAGLIHRDIKPSNILIDPKGTVKITDFGIARAAGGSQLETDGSVFGTPPYMAPEQLLGLEVDARCDVFSLGTVLYEMLTGGKPFTGESAAEVARRTLEDELTPVLERAPDVSPAVAAVVERAMQRDAGSRYASMKELAEALARAAGRPDDDAAGQVTARLLAARAAGVDTSPTGLLGGSRAKVLLGGLRKWAAEPWAARVRLLFLAGLLAVVAGAAGSWWLFDRIGREESSAPPGADLPSFQARLVSQGRQHLEEGSFDAAIALFTLAEQLGPDVNSPRDLRLRAEAEAQRRGVSSAPVADRVSSATGPRQAVEALREAFEERGSDPEVADVLAQLDAELAGPPVAADSARLELAVRSERERGTVTLYADDSQVLQLKFRGKGRRLFGGSHSGRSYESVDVDPAIGELKVYVAVHGRPAELHRFVSPFDGGQRHELTIGVDQQGVASVSFQ